MADVTPAIRPDLSAPSGIRTHTVRVLNPLSRPIGVPGQAEPSLQRGQRSHDNLPLDGSLLGVSQNALRVVIAEDEALIRLDLKEMLEEEGYLVVAEAADGEAAIEKVTALRPDLAIFDVKMPILDGISAAERIAGERIAPVVILTAFSQRELVERARDAGAMAYLVKPFTKADLVPAIEMAVSRYTEIRALDQEVNNLKDRLEVRKLLDRAKGLLQSEHGMTEPQAFRWIQKTSMDRRLTMRKVAEAVIEGTMSASAQPEEQSE
jgi:AmiR/NasT family two-component response regulator